MMRRLLLIAPASFVVLAACAWYWLLHTESGLHWIWARAQSATGHSLQAQLIQGDLGSGVTIRQLAYATESITLDVNELRLVADLDLLPLQLQISGVVIDDTVIHISASEEVSPTNDIRNVIESLALPLSLLIKDVSANNIKVSGLNAANDIELTQLALAASWHEEIVIDHLLVNSLGSTADINATLGLTRPFPATIHGELSGAPALTGLPEAVAFQLRADGSLDELNIDVTSSPVEMSLQGSVANLLESLSWDLQAQLTETTIDLGENDTEVRITDVHAISSGNLDEYLLTASAALDTLDFEPLQFSTSGTGTTTSFDFSELGLRSADVDLSGNGRIAWGDNWSIESRLGVATFNPGALLASWPAEHPIRGELSLLLNEDHLAISDSYLTAGDTGMSVQVDARVDLAASIVAGAVRWQDAKWPLVGDDPAISSKSGNISVDGTVDDWRIDGAIEIGTATIPLGTLRVDGSGDRQHVEATIIDSEVLGGNVAGYAAFNWRDQQAWSAGLEMSGIELGTIAADLPVNVTGKVDADGNMSPFRLDHFAASDLTILHGDTRIELDGDPFALSALTFDVALSDASRYLAEASGGFAATGRISLHPEQPSLRIDASSSAFGFGEIQATGIEIVDQSGDDGAINAAILVEQLDVYGEIIDNVTIGLFADSVAQNVRLDASHGNSDIHLFVAGEVDDLNHPSNWQGELRELSLTLAGEPLAELPEPTAISLSENAVTIDYGCIAASAGMRICAQADWLNDSHLDVGADLTDVPVELVNNFISTGLQFDQLVSGSFQWTQDKEAGTTGSAKISMSAGTVTSNDYPDASIVTETGLLSFDIANGQLRSGIAELSMPGFGHVAAQFSIPDITDGTDSSIKGLFDINLTDMAVLAALSPLVDAATGEFRADLTLSGTLSDPELVGDMAVTDGSLAYVPMGLQLDDINLTSLLHEDGRIELSGDFLAGEGRGEIVTRADYSTTGEKGFELELRGDNMTLIDTPNVTARANLDVRVAYDYKTLALDGDVLVSHARVNTSSLTAVSHSESEDVVIIAGELPDGSLRQSREQGTWISGSIGVEFGDDVSIDLGPATAKVIGKTVFSWGEDLIPIADGRYDLTGSIQVFGQVLEITEGGLRFSQVPANNPYIRIRAEREIYGNAQVKTAGVLLDGTLRQLAIEPYTRPLTTEERALTLLVTGSDFDFEQGLGAIDFGTYIAPRVFVSYGFGLFETENVIRVRYDLKRGFGITATSGQKETGLDLSYRIER